MQMQSASSGDKVLGVLSVGRGSAGFYLKRSRVLGFRELGLGL